VSRKSKSIDLAQVEAAASVGCTVDEIAVIVGLSARQFQRRQKEPSFLDAVERGRAKGRASLRKTQWQSAHGVMGPDGKYILPPNVTAQIWLGKQLLGQRSFEKPEPEKPPEKPDKIVYEWVSPKSDAGSNTDPSPAREGSTTPEPDSKASVDPLDPGRAVH
jgi:hypothetical protein